MLLDIGRWSEREKWRGSLRKAKLAIFGLPHRISPLRPTKLGVLLERGASSRVSGHAQGAEKVGQHLGGCVQHCGLDKPAALAAHASRLCRKD